MRFMSFSATALCFFALAVNQTAFAEPNALDFDGTDDRVEAPLPSLFTDLSNNDFTVSVWVRPQIHGASQRVLFAQQSSTEFATLLINSSRVPYLFVTRNGTNISVDSQASLPADQWSHVTARWNHATSTTDIYINGQPAGGISGGGSSTGNNGVMMIGARSDGQQNIMGTLENFRLWSTVRTPEQIRAEMTSSCFERADLVAEYEFDQGVAGDDNAAVTSLLDSSGNSFDGTLLNFALVGSTSNWVASDVMVSAPGLVFDPPLPETISTSEDGSGFATTVRLSGAPDTDISVSLASSNVNEGVVAPAALNFTPATWDIPQAVTFTGVDDSNFDYPAEYDFTATFSGTGLACWTSLVETYPAVNANDDFVHISTQSADSIEGDFITGGILFEATLGADYPGGFQLPYATADDTAFAGNDYVATSGLLTFEGTSGETRTFSVQVIPNTDSEDDRQFLVNLGPASAPGVTANPAQVAGGILDDDPDAGVVLTPGALFVHEGETLGYTLRADNNSPLFDANGILINSLTTPALENIAWTCIGSGGASCAPSGSDDLAETVDLPPNAHVIFDVSGTVPISGGTGNSALDILASLVPPADDKNPANDGDESTVTILHLSLFGDGFESIPPAP